MTPTERAESGSGGETLSAEEIAMAAPMESEKALVLRLCRKDMTSSSNRLVNGESVAVREAFRWPESGEVTFSDWDPTPVCGGGGHGWLYGQGDHTVCDLFEHEGARWLVVEVVLAECVVLGGKVKFPRGTVVFVGDRKAATDYLIRHEPRANAGVIGAERHVGDNETGEVGAYGLLTGGNGATLTGGDYATLTGGNGATLTGGDYATLTGGYRATLTGGDYATLTGGYRATLTGGYRATLTGGDYATLTGGNGATLTGGNGATLTGGNGATLTGGNGATLTGGDRATLTGGDYAELRFAYWDSKAERMRTKLAYVGEDGIEPNVPYRLNNEREVVRVEVAAS